MIQFENSFDFDQEWKRQQEIFAQMKEMGMQEYANAILRVQGTKISELFDPHFDPVLSCMDERVGYGGIRAAGSLIFYEDEDAIRFIKESGAEGLTSHEDCGAAKRYAIAERKTPEMADEIGRVRIERLAKLATQALDHEIRYLGDTPVAPEKHISRCLYYIGTKGFNRNFVHGFPPGFLLSRRFANPQQILKETQVGIEIALGASGFGKERITANSPFFLIPIGEARNPQFSLSALTEELDKFLNTLPEDIKNRVYIDGFEV